MYHCPENGTIPAASPQPGEPRLPVIDPRHNGTDRVTIRSPLDINCMVPAAITIRSLFESPYGPCCSYHTVPVWATIWSQLELPYGPCWSSYTVPVVVTVWPLLELRHGPLPHYRSSHLREPYTTALSQLSEHANLAELLKDNNIVTQRKTFTAQM